MLVQDGKQLYLLDETTDALGSSAVPTQVCRQKFHGFLLRGIPSLPAAFEDAGQRQRRRMAFKP